MDYFVSIKRSAQKSLSSINKAQRVKIIQQIQKLLEEPRPSQCKKLVGRNGWRIRIGRYRVIYEINDDELNA